MIIFAVVLDDIFLGSFDGNERGGKFLICLFLFLLMNGKLTEKEKMFNFF